MFRDEAAYLAEWIEFHRLVGVEHFFLYDNLSSDSSRAVLEPWLRAGVATVTRCPIPLMHEAQAWVYADALEQARGSARWLAFIDIDEFLFSPERDWLPATLREYESHPGVIVNWQVYGSAGRGPRPPGLVIESFGYRARTDWIRNRRVKSIVNPARAVRCRGPHFFEFEGGELSATENHELAHVAKRRPLVRRLSRWLRSLPLVETDPYAIHRSSLKRVSVQRLRINHYAVKSREEFAAKANRLDSADVPEARRPRVAGRYFRYHDRNDVHDPVLDRYVPRLLSRLEQLGHDHPPRSEAAVGPPPRADAARSGNVAP